ncbi:MAG: ATP-binding protein [Candidatus Thorarchaeota archaeon]|jgi:signal transduction histidine kinase
MKGIGSLDGYLQGMISSLKDYVKEAISLKDRPRGLGLLGMKERVELVGGILKIRSHPGRGTEIEIEIPMNYEVPDE